MQVIGSGNLVHTLQAAGLIDQYHVWNFPVILGKGKRLFSESAQPTALQLVHSQVSNSGVLMSTYVPKGAVQPGSFPTSEPSEKELRRRQRMAAGAW